MKSRFSFDLIGALLVLVAAGIGTSYFFLHKEPYTYPIVYAIQDIRKGTPLNQAMLTEKWIKASHIPPEAAIGLDSCIGHTAKCNVSTGQLLSRYDVDAYHLPANQAVSPDSIKQSAKEEAKSEIGSKGNVVLTSRKIQAGKVLEVNDLYEKEIEFSGVYRDSLSSASLAAGRRVKYTLGSNKQIGQHDLEPESRVPEAP